MLRRFYHWDALRAKQGFTLLEVLATITIVMILATIVQPVMHGARQRAKEVELKFKLRAVRRAIDRFKQDWDRDHEKHYGQLCLLNKISCNAVSGDYGYPRNLEDLMEINYMEGPDEKTKRYLRAVPVDPMTGSAEWGLRCYQDPPDEDSWCGDDVFDIYSLSEEATRDGVYYNEW